MQGLAKLSGDTDAAPFTLPSFEIVRMFLVYDKAPNGAAPTLANIFRTPDAGGVAGWLREPLYYSRFEVLAEDEVVLRPHIAQSHDDPLDVISWTTCKEPFKFVWKGKKLVSYKGSGATIGDINTGAFWIVCGQSGNVHAIEVQMQTHVRYRSVGTWKV